MTSLAAAVALFVMSCSKKSDPAPTAEQYLTHSAGWKLTDAKAGSTDIFSSLPTCSTDDIFKFTLTSGSTGTYIEDEGASKCDSSDPQTADSGKWVLSSDGKQLLIINPDTTTLTVATLNSTTFSVTFTEDDGNGPYTATETFTAQ